MMLAVVSNTYIQWENDKRSVKEKKMNHIH